MKVTIEQPTCGYCHRKLKLNRMWQNMKGQNFSYFVEWICPHGCGYTLTELTLPRCPTCGQVIREDK